MNSSAGGWGLAELMVALAVGAIVALFGTSLLLGANSALAAQSDAAAVDDMGRYVLETIGRAVRQAGWGLQDSATPALQQVDGDLRIAFSGAADGSMLNCAGSAEEAGVGFSVFYLDGDALRCKYRNGSSWSAQPMAQGVKEWRLWFGVDTDATRDGIANRWLRAEEVADWRHVTHLRISFALVGKQSRQVFQATCPLENGP
jgi:type IV pilus assembly protein PilW